VDAVGLLVGVGVLFSRADMQPARSLGPSSRAPTTMRQPWSRPRPFRGVAEVRVGTVRRGEAAEGGGVVVVGTVATFGGSGTAGGGKNSGDGLASESARADADGVVFDRDVVLRGRAAADAGLFPAGREEEGVELDRVEPAPLAGVARFGSVVRRGPAGVVFAVVDALRGGELAVFFVERGEEDEAVDEGVEGAFLSEAADVFRDALHTTQVRLSWALCVPQSTHSHPRTEASGFREALRRTGRPSSHTRQVRLLRVLCVPQASHCHVGFAAMSV